MRYELYAVLFGMNLRYELYALHRRKKEGLGKLDVPSLSLESPGALAERRPPIVVFGASRGPVLFYMLVVPKAFGLAFYMPGVTASHADLVGTACSCPAGKAALGAHR